MKQTDEKTNDSQTGDASVKEGEIRHEEEAAADYSDQIKQIIDDIVDSNDNMTPLNLYDPSGMSFPPGLMNSNQLPRATSPTLGSSLRIPGFSLAVHNSQPTYPGSAFSSDSSLISNKNSISQKQQTRKNSGKMSSTQQGLLYNIQINDDICLLERIGSAINSISSNHDPFCPYCLKYIDLKKINFQNVSAYYSKTTKKHYLTHFDCYYKASKSQSWKMRVLSELPEARLTVAENLPQNEIAALSRADKKIMFVSVEGVHPIGGSALFRIEKALNLLEDNSSNNYVFFHDLEKHVAALYEPNSYVLPFPEFICKVSIANNFSNEDFVSFEFLVNAFQALSNADQNPKSYEITYSQGSIQASIGVSAVLDTNQELVNSLNIRLPAYDGQTSTGDSQKNRVLVIKYLKICSPIAKKAKIDLRKPGVNMDISNIRIDEGAEFGQANLEEPFPNENTEKGRTFLSIDSPITNISKTINSFSSFSPMSFLEGNYFQRTAGPLNNEASQFSHLASYVNQQNIHGNSAVGNKPGEPNQKANSLIFASQLGTTSASLNNIEEIERSGSDLQTKQPNSLSFLPDYDQDDQGDIFTEPQQFRIMEHQGKVGELAVTPSGSKMIQQFIPKASQMELEVLISELMPVLKDIMLDPYSNYMLLTLLQHSSPEQRNSLLKNIITTIPYVGRHKKGTHSLQSIVAIIKGEEEEKLFEQGLQDCLMELSKDAYGTHFVQKVVNTLSMKRITFIFNTIICNFTEIAQNSHGLCVLKAMISRTEKDSERKRLLIQLIAKNLEELIQNPYGNYAIQHAFEVYKEDCKEIWDRITAKPVQFCIQKFSSNVIEKYLETASFENRKKFIEAVVRNERFLELMTNKYGSFVLQRVFTLSDDNEKKMFVFNVSKNIEKIHSSQHRARWTNFLEECKKSGKYDLVFQNILKQQQMQHQQLHLQHFQQQQQLYQQQQQLQFVSKDSHFGYQNSPIPGPNYGQEQFKKQQQYLSEPEEINAAEEFFNEISPGYVAVNSKKAALKKNSQSFTVSYPVREDDLARQWQASQYPIQNIGSNMQVNRSYQMPSTTQQNWNSPFPSYPMTPFTNMQSYGTMQNQLKNDLQFQGGNSVNTGTNAFSNYFPGQ